MSQLTVSVSTVLAFLLIILPAFSLPTDKRTSYNSSSVFSRASRGCEYEGVLHPAGSKFKGRDACTNCFCPRRGGVANCIVDDCAQDKNCLRYEEARGAYACCPKCVEMGCRHTDGKTYQQGDVIRNEPCVRCYCPVGGGNPVCDVTSCPLSECVDPVSVPGVCCPVCLNGPNCKVGVSTISIGQSEVVEGATCTCENFVDIDGVKRVLARCNKVRKDSLE